MTCRAIVELNFRNSMRKNGLGIRKNHSFPATKNSEGFIEIDFAIDKDNPNRMLITEVWETKENHQKNLGWRMEEDPTVKFPNT